MSTLENSVCLVTGASRGIGRGIALGLGQRGAIVYITGRTLKPKGGNVGGSLEETAVEISSMGGKAIPVVVDHREEKQVMDLFDRIHREQRGRLDILVNSAYSGVEFLVQTAGKAYYELDLCSPGEAWDTINNVGLRNNYICSTLATRMMMDYRKHQPTARPGLIVNISSFGGRNYLFNPIYGCGKEALDRMTRDMAVELDRNEVNICVVSLWPGFVRTEEVMSRAVNVTEGFLAPFNDRKVSESTELSGFVVAALACEDRTTLMARSGSVVMVSDVAKQYRLHDPDGTVPPDYRSLQCILRLGRYRLAGLVPSFIRLPMWLFLWFIAKNKHRRR